MQYFLFDFQCHCMHIIAMHANGKVFERGTKSFLIMKPDLALYMYLDPRGFSTQDGKEGEWGEGSVCQTPPVQSPCMGQLKMERCNFLGW